MRECSRCKTSLVRGQCPKCAVPPPPAPKILTPAPPPPLPGISGPPPLGIAEPGPLATDALAAQGRQLAKASLFRRFLGFSLDGVVAAGPLLVLWQLGIVDDGPVGFIALGWAGIYWLFRDGFGASLGKVLLALRVVRARDGMRSGLGRSLLRNLVPVLLIILTRHPLLSSLALLAEPALAVLNPQGKRLGDMLAGTQVVKK